jgi:ankyrin repeat protein
MKAHFFGLAILYVSATASAADGSLLDAAESGNREAALQFLQAGGDVDARRPDGTTAAMWAAYNGDVELLQQLIDAGADVNAVNNYGVTALSEASIIGAAPLIAALLNAGADANFPNHEGETPLMVAARAGSIAAAELLLKAGAEINAKESWGGQSALMWAAAQSHPEMVAYLAASGADVNARGVTRQWERKIIMEPRPKDMNKGGFTPLLYAAREGCIECAKSLLEAGADPDLADPERVTPLNLALINLHFDFAAFMIDAGANVDKWDLFGRTPLYMAVDTNTLPTMGNGAMVVLPSLDERTALDIMVKLLDAGADPNIRLKRRPPYRNVPQDRNGDAILAQGATPLLRAARAGDAAAVELLLQRGALVDLPSKEGVTPLMAAAGVEYGLRVTRGRNRTDEGVLATLQLLLDAGADIHARMVVEPNGGPAVITADRRGDFSYSNGRGRQVPGPHALPHRTALHGAAMKGFNPIVEFLVAHGAELNATDANGRTPLDLAMGRYEENYLRQAAEPHVETVQLLEKLIADSTRVGSEVANRQ